jgi:hypothetical protein
VPAMPARLSLPKSPTAASAARKSSHVTYDDLQHGNVCKERSTLKGVRIEYPVRSAFYYYRRQMGSTACKAVRLLIATTTIITVHACLSLLQCLATVVSKEADLGPAAQV